MKPKNKLPPWLKPKNEPSKVILSVGWYTEGNWLKVKEASVDSDRFEDTYHDWLNMADEAMADMLAAGVVAKKFFIESESLLAWCILHGKVNDASARAEFVSVQSSKQNAGDA